MSNETPAEVLADIREKIAQKPTHRAHAVLMYLDRLSRMLRDHVNKGDPRDVANFCMFLWNRGEAIAALQQEGKSHG